MLEKVKRYLKASDIEMKQLGAVLLRENFPFPQWEQVLQECLYPKSEEDIDKQFFSSAFVSTPSAKLATSKKIKHYITNTDGYLDIVIEEIDSSIWSQLNNSQYKSTYDISNFNLSTLSDALKEYDKNKNTTTPIFTIKTNTNEQR